MNLNILRGDLLALRRVLDRRFAEVEAKLSASTVVVLKNLGL